MSLVLAMIAGAAVTAAVWVLNVLLVAMGMAYQDYKEHTTIAQAILLATFLAVAIGALVAFAIGGLK